MLESGIEEDVDEHTWDDGQKAAWPVACVPLINSEILSYRGKGFLNQGLALGCIWQSEYYQLRMCHGKSSYKG